MSTIAVIGTGYVGLATGVGLAHLGHDVVCADIDADKVARLQRGDVPIHEDGMADLVAALVASGNLNFVHGAASAVPGREFVFLAVPTPQDGDGSADMRHVIAAAAEIGPRLEPGAVVINKSTVPVGSSTVVAHALGRDDVSVASNPEFLREGTALHDVQHPARIVVGADDPDVAKRVAALYDGIDAPLVLTDAASAEMVKYASNTFLAMKLSFVNSVAALCEATGADVVDVLEGMGHDPRIGSEYLRPGPGWGGSCFPKDTRAMVRIADDHDFDFVLLRRLLEQNDEQFERVVAKVRRAVGGDLRGTTIALLGLAFKAGTDDTRDSPALAILQRLLAAGASVVAYDPVARADAPGLVLAADPYEACDGADAVVVLTEWPEFAALDLDEVAARLRRPAMVDGRNMFDPAAARAAGLDYQGLGRS